MPDLVPFSRFLDLLEKHLELIRKPPYGIALPNALEFAIRDYRALEKTAEKEMANWNEQESSDKDEFVRSYEGERE